MRGKISLNSNSKIYIGLGVVVHVGSSKSSRIYIGVGVVVIEKIYNR